MKSFPVNKINSKEFRLCLINVVDRSYLDEAPLNLLYLADYLVKNKILSRKQIRIIDLDFEDPVKIVEKFEPNLIGFSVITAFYSLAADIANKIKEKYPVTTIIGGYHISSLPEKLKQPFDIGVLGEGEATLAELVSVFKKNKTSVSDAKLEKIPGITFINKLGKIVKTQIRLAIDTKKADALDWSLLHAEKIFQNQVFLVDGKPQVFKTVRIYSARGCPYNCAFCAHRVVWTGVRYFSAKKVVDEIEALYKDYGVQSFQIMDDTFAISKPRARDLIRELKERNLLGKVFFSHLFIRANLIDEEFVQILKEFGAISVFIGIEFGSARLLKRYKDGQLTNEQVKNSTKLFGKYNIFVFGSFMLFAPTETKEETEETYQLAKWFANQKNALSLGYSVTTPYPGTKLWTEAVDMGILDTDKLVWDDFLMFDLSSGDRDMTKIFFYNDYSDRDTEKIWAKFAKLSNHVQQKLESIPGWTESLIEADRQNQKLRAALALKQRAHDLFVFPKYYLRQILTKPEKITSYFYYFIKDLQRFNKKHK